MVTRILDVEVYSVGLAALFLAPVALAQAILHQWAGIGVYGRVAAWGGVFLVACLLLIRVAS